MIAAMYLLLLVALVCANLPFVTQRWFGLKRLPEKRFIHHLPELLAGFYAKFSVLKALVGQGFVWPAVFAVVMSLIGAFYYLRVVKVMYMDESAEPAQAPAMCVGGRVVLSACALALLLFGLMPSLLMDWCVYALAKTF